ncbi:2-keto-3-deoxy-L-rhamnonate aldolase [Colletotrichum liriopes]|uniref:2-keto-3-deoxy-L-rhamnonate aldolase n=1 Tax=Colletotrichum liriopes TaxID=708192 RepID=A0AA37GYC1_9PEZI|nr:2-keto-3-deoxy-L-rhamnonate aldolase [Colletotrichum liriopes]
MVLSDGVLVGSHRYGTWQHRRQSNVSSSRGNLNIRGVSDCANSCIGALDDEESLGLWSTCNHGTDPIQEQAEGIVRACKYPSSRWPQGLRGAGAMYAPAAFNQTGREYLLSANDNVMICVQIESRKAVENVEEIAAVDGIDMLFIGPNDLASSMGYVAFDHASIPDVQKASARVLKAGLDAGKYVGHFALSADAAAAKYHQGFHFVNCGADIVAITTWMSSEMGKLKILVEAGTRKIGNRLGHEANGKSEVDCSQNVSTIGGHIGYS